MKNKKIIYVLILCMTALLLFSCQEQSPQTSSNGDNLNGNASFNDDEDTVVTQIGELMITTLKGQEPFQNEDGTITLPDGGIYTDNRDYKITITGMTIIRSDGSFSKDIDSGFNTDTVAIMEGTDGSVFNINKDGGVSYYFPEKEDESPITDRPPIEIDDERLTEYRLFEFADGTKITMTPGSPVTDTRNQRENKYTLILTFPSIIELTNGATVGAPADTIVVLISDILDNITIGDGEAIITQADGTTSTVPAGTILGNEGNIK